MRALIATGIEELEVGDAPDPEVTAGSVIVRTAVSGVSAGTERRKLQEPTLGERDVRDDWPVVGAFGYMASGRVEAVGPDVTDVSVGDRVHAGRPFGGHRELIDVAATGVVRVPEDLDDVVAACMYWAVPPLLGLLAARPTFYEDAAIVGLGPLGLCAVQLFARSSRRVVAVDPIAPRRELALSLGASAAVDPTTTDFDDALRAAAPERPEVVIEVSGSQAGLETALRIVRPRGRVAIVGSQRPLHDFDLFWPLQHSGASIVPIHRLGATSPQAGGIDSPARRYLPDIVGMLRRGWLDLGPLITDVVRLDEAPAAFARLIARPDENVGLAIDWRR